MTDLNTADLFTATTPAMVAPAKPKPHRHVWVPTVAAFPATGVTSCVRCGAIRDETRARRGRQSRNYGNRAELSVARTYGGTKVGHAGGPVDVVGAEFATQVKTHRRLPPAEWRKAFAGMAQSRGVPRLLLRFVIGNGQPPEDFIVVPGKAWLDWFGKDEERSER